MISQRHGGRPGRRYVELQAWRQAHKLQQRLGRCGTLGTSKGIMQPALDGLSAPALCSIAVDQQFGLRKGTGGLELCVQCLPLAKTAVRDNFALPSGLIGAYNFDLVAGVAATQAMV